MLRCVDVADCFRKFADVLDNPETFDRLRATDPKAEKLTVLLRSMCWYSENLAGVRLFSVARSEILDLLGGDVTLSK